MDQVLNYPNGTLDRRFLLIQRREWIRVRLLPCTIDQPDSGFPHRSFSSDPLDPFGFASETREFIDEERLDCVTESLPELALLVRGWDEIVNGHLLPVPTFLLLVE